MNTATLQWQYFLTKSHLKVANVLKRGLSKAMGDLNRARADYHRAIYGPAERYEGAIPIEIRGIPCSFHVESHRAAVDEQVFGVHPDHAMPGDPASVEGVICDRGGYRAKWLDCMADRDDLERQVLEFLRERHAG